MSSTKLHQSQQQQTTRQRGRKRNSSSTSTNTIKRGDELFSDPHQPNKDRFIDLAQAALEEADIEEERKGVIHEVMEALIAKTGAPLVAEVISEQLHSQDVIERIAEHHEEDRQRLNNSPHMTRIDSTDSINSLKEPDSDELDEKQDILYNDENSLLSPEPSMALVAEYLWRFFRVLLLASLVGLVYHFLNV